MAWLVIVVCGLLALALVPGMFVAATLREWWVLGLGLMGLVLLVSVAGITFVLLNRQRQILQAGETLLHLRDEAEADPRGGPDPSTGTGP